MNGAELTKNHEGYVEGLYIDSEGYVSCGYGHCLDWETKVKTLKEWHEIQFINAYGEAEADYLNLGFDLDAVRRCAVVDLLYNLGPVKFSKFKQFAAALKMKDWLSAVTALEHSLWFKQVGRRGPRICNLIRTGKWESL